MKLRTKIIVGIVVVVCIGGGTILASTKPGQNMVEWITSRGQVGSESQQKKEYAEQQKLAEDRYGKSKSSSESKKEKPKKKKSKAKESKKESASSSSSDIDTDTITVVYGDSLSSIAADHNMTVKELVSLNDMENTTLRPGQELKVVAGSGRTYTEDSNDTSSDTTSDTTSSDETTSSDYSETPSTTSADVSSETSNSTNNGSSSDDTSSTNDNTNQ